MAILISSSIRTKEAELPADESTDVSSDKSKQAAKNCNLMAIASRRHFKTMAYST
jgi:hypothetical protein